MLPAIGIQVDEPSWPAGKSGVTGQVHLIAMLFCGCRADVLSGECPPAAGFARCAAQAGLGTNVLRVGLLPAERQPGPDLDRWRGGYHVDPGGAGFQRGYDRQLQHNYAGVFPWCCPAGAGGVPSAVAVAYPHHWQGPDPPGVAPGVVERDAAGQHVQDGVRLAVMQAEDRDLDAV